MQSSEGQEEDESVPVHGTISWSRDGLLCTAERRTVLQGRKAVEEIVKKCAPEVRTTSFPARVARLLSTLLVGRSQNPAIGHRICAGLG